MDLVSPRHEFLATYMQYVANTESPRLFHVWVALSAVSACLGRRCWFDQGVGKVWPNMYVVLVGPPGTRKGHAIRYASSILRERTGVRFAPNDTGGQRQGLIAAMTDIGDENAEETLSEIASDLNQGGTITLSGLVNGKRQDLLDKVAGIEIDNRDPRTMFVAASELNSILGENNTAMLTFLQEMYDGGDYQYKLKNTEYTIKDGLLGIVGATTPTQISIALPPVAVGQGFTSRVVFVFDDKQYARIARPSLDEKSGARIADIFASVFDRFGGAFGETGAAAKLHDDIYFRGSRINDTRFVHYCDRRQTHLQKLAMSLAAGRGSMTIDVVDYEFADNLLLATEERMPDALGEYGMSKLSAAKQRLVEFISSSPDPIPTNALYASMQKDMTAMEFKASVADLHNAKKLSYISVPGLGQCVIGVAASGLRKAKHDYGDLSILMEKKHG